MTISDAQRVANRTGRTVFAAERPGGLRYLPDGTPVFAIVTDALNRPVSWREVRPEPRGTALDAAARTAGLHNGTGIASQEVRDDALRLVRALRLTFGVSVEDDRDNPAGQYQRLLRGIGALERMRQADPELRQHGRFTMDLLNHAAEAYADSTPDGVRALLHAAPATPPGTRLRKVLGLPAVEGAISWLASDTLTPDRLAARILGLGPGSGPGVTEADRQRLFWAMVKAYASLAAAPDQDALAVKALHLADPTSPVDQPRREELFWLATAAAAAGRDVRAPAALAAFHLEQNGALSPGTQIRSADGRVLGRNWSGTPLTAPLAVDRYVMSPDGSLAGAPPTVRRGPPTRTTGACGGRPTSWWPAARPATSTCPGRTAPAAGFLRTRSPDYWPPTAR